MNIHICKSCSLSVPAHFLPTTGGAGLPTDDGAASTSGLSDERRQGESAAAGSRRDEQPRRWILERMVRTKPRIILNFIYLFIYFPDQQR